MSLFKKILSHTISERILIIDPVEAAAYNRRKFGVDNFGFPDVESALFDIYQTLSKVKKAILETITQIIVINPGNEESEFTEERQEDFINKLNNFNQTAIRISNEKGLLKLFQHSVFLNYTNDLERIKLLDYTRNKGILFFDFTLSRAIINHLHTALSNKQISGYNKFDDESKTDWKEIGDTEKYISIAYVLTVKTISSSEEEERLKRMQSTIEEYFERFLSIIKLNPSGKFLVILGNESVPDFHTLRKGLVETNESFHFIECPPESFEKLPEHKRIFIKNVQKLLGHKLFNLCSLVINKDNRDKLVILHSDRNIDIDFPEFNVYPFYSLKQADEVFKKYLEMQMVNQDIVENLAEDIEHLIRNNVADQKQVKRRLSELDELRTIDKYANSKKYNFWYRFHSLKFPSMEIRNKIILSELDNYFRDPKLTPFNTAEIESDWIKFEHKHNKADWEIFNRKGKRFPRQPYMGSKGIKYMAMLVKQYEYPSEIPIENLIKKINSWNKNDIKYRTQSDQLVKMFIRTDLKKIDNQLLYLYKDFKIKDTCYYEPETELKIFVEDEDFPS